MPVRDLAKTADVVAASGDAAASLVRASAPLHLLGAACFAFAAWATPRSGPHLVVAPVLLLVALGAVVGAPRAGWAATLGLVVVPTALGACVAALDARLPGVAPTTAVAVLAGELVATLCWLAARPRPAGAASLFAAAVTVPALLVAADRGLLDRPTTTLGIAAASVVASCVIVAARLGEQAAPYRHAAAQRVEAASSRFVEVPRALVLLFVRSEP
jgi:hypothetical protein